MNKLTVILNDYGANSKSYISFSSPDIEKVYEQWDQPDERLTKLVGIDAFRGYEKWSELTPNHYRILVSSALKELAKLPSGERSNSESVVVNMANFVILAFIISLENATKSEIEQFRINRFDDLNVTFDYSASFELEYSRPQGKTPPETPEPAFSIVVDNTDG